MENLKLGHGCEPSKKDKRMIKHGDLATATAPLVSGGIDYLPQDILMQSNVGICTAISRVQLRQKQTGKRYSPEFQYLLQKKFIDQNWTEGSSVLSANKVAQKYGFLPAELWTYTTEEDRKLSYGQYIAKLEKINDLDINRLLTLCVDKIQGYAKVDEKDPQAIALAISNSPQQAGILCRYGCQKNWWTSITGIVSWNSKDINPLRNGKETSGHAIINSRFNYSQGYWQKLANTWSPAWCLNGSADINWGNYPMTECFVDLPSNPMFQFTKDMKLGDRNNDVKELQKRLGVIQTGWFGPLTKIAVQKYQKAHNLVADGFCGLLTRTSLNS